MSQAPPTSSAITTNQGGSQGGAQGGSASTSNRTADATAQIAGQAAGGDPAGELRTFLSHLLAMQVRLVGGLAGAVYLIGGGGRPGGVFARFETPGSRPVNLEGAGPKLEKIIEAACRSAAALAKPDSAARGGPIASPGVAEVVRLTGGSGLYGDEPAFPVLASPLVAAGRVEGCSLVVLPEVRGGRLPPDTDDALARLSLAAVQFEAYLWRQHAMGEAQQKALLRQTLELLDASQQGQNAAAMGALLCHELATRFGCTRVSIGLIGRGDRLRVVAVSGTDQVDRKGAAAESIEAAMEECAAQDVEIAYPASPDPAPAERRVTRAHDAHSKKFGPAAMVSLPLRVEGDLVGVVLLERDATDPFPAGSLPLLRLVAEFIGPGLWTRRLADRGIVAVSRDRTRALGAAIVGPRHTGSKIAVMTLLAALAAATFVPIPARVVAEATIEAQSRRTIMPPFTGYLGEVHVRPGDTISSGTLLARMDTQSIELDRDEARARREATNSQRDQALARQELEKVRAADAQIAEIDARLNLLEHQLSRASILSPIDGRVAQGDQRDFVGSRVEPTSPLFEVIDDGRIVAIDVDERDITRVTVGQEGWIAPRARPDQRATIRVERINPVAQASDRSNVYRVEASVVGEPPDWLRPGATAIARLKDGSTTAMALFLKPIVDEIRMNWWW